MDIFIEVSQPTVLHWMEEEEQEQAEIEQLRHEMDMCPTGEEDDVQGVECNELSDFIESRSVWRDIQDNYLLV